MYQELGSNQRTVTDTSETDVRICECSRQCEWNSMYQSPGVEREQHIKELKPDVPGV